MIETVGVEMINTSAVPLYLPSGTVIAVAQEADSLIENVIEDPWADIIRTQDGDTGPSNVAADTASVSVAASVPEERRTHGDVASDDRGKKEDNLEGRNVVCDDQTPNESEANQAIDEDVISDAHKSLEKLTLPLNRSVVNDDCKVTEKDIRDMVDSAIALDCEQKEQLFNLLWRHRRIFETTLKNSGTSVHLPHKIDTGDSRPVYILLYRKSKKKHKIEEEETQKNLRAGII